MKIRDFKIYFKLFWKMSFGKVDFIVAIPSYNVDSCLSTGLTKANSVNPISRRYLCVKNNDLLYKPGFFRKSWYNDICNFTTLDGLNFCLIWF